MSSSIGEGVQRVSRRVFYSYRKFLCQSRDISGDIIICDLPSSGLLCLDDHYFEIVTPNVPLVGLNVILDLFLKARCVTTSSHFAYLVSRHLGIPATASSENVEVLPSDIVLAGNPSNIKTGWSVLRLTRALQIPVMDDAVICDPGLNAFYSNLPEEEAKKTFRRPRLVF